MSAGPHERKRVIRGDRTSDRNRVKCPGSRCKGRGGRLLRGWMWRVRGQGEGRHLGPEQLGEE